MANRDSENSVLTRELVLALDIATHTGYFSLHEAGTWNFTESKRRNGNKMHGAFRTTLLSLLRRYGIRRVVAEDVSVNRHFYDMRRLSELRGILLEVCDELDIPEPEFVNPAVLKNGRRETDMPPRRRWSRPARIGTVLSRWMTTRRMPATSSTITSAGTGCDKPTTVWIFPGGGNAAARSFN